MGALVLAAAVLLAVVVTAAFKSGRMAGSPQPISVPGPPAVGDCVPHPVDMSTLDDQSASPSLQFETCDGMRYGEVVGILSNPGQPAPARETDSGGWVLDPNTRACFDKEDQYVAGEMLFHYWSPRIFAFTAPVGPSKRQRSVGQHWLACTMFSPSTADQSAVARYHGSLRNAFVTGNERDMLGFCGSGDDWTKRYVDCASPHDFQVLASGVVGGGAISRAELQRTCVQVARRLSGRPDVTAAGALAVAVQDIRGTGASFSSDGVQVPAKVGCGFTTAGPRQLGGSLVAVGKHPIPWS